MQDWQIVTRGENEAAVYRNIHTGLFVGLHALDRGLMVTGRTEREAMDKIPAALAELRAAQAEAKTLPAVSED